MKAKLLSTLLLISSIGFSDIRFESEDQETIEMRYKILINLNQIQGQLDTITRDLSDQTHLLQYLLKLAQQHEVEEWKDKKPTP